MIYHIWSHIGTAKPTSFSRKNFTWRGRWVRGWPSWVTNMAAAASNSVSSAISSGYERAQEGPFSEPWRSSNLILVVEGRKFHVHRDVLIVCSPVFEAMLSSNFKEKSAHEIPLPEKKADEIEQLLENIYPDRECCITKENCLFLLTLSFEYQIDLLKVRCENYICSWRNRDMTKDEAIEVIVLSQKYPLNDKTVQACVTKFVSQEMKWEDLKKHRLFSQLEPANAQRLIEERVKHLEKARESDRIHYEGQIHMLQYGDDW